MSGPLPITGVGLIARGADSAAALHRHLAKAPEDAQAHAGAGAADGLPIEGFEIRDYLKRRGLKDLSRTSRLAIAAASRLAPDLDGVPAERVGVVLGTAWASLDTVVRFEREAQVEGPRFVDPILFTETVANVPAGQVSIVFGWSALNLTVSAGSASGLSALVEARSWLDEGRADVLIAGGADERNAQLLRVREADGHRWPGSEGACLLALERADAAAARNASVLGRLGTGGVRSIGDGIEERARIVAGALDAEGVRPADIDLVILSGRGEDGADRLETDVLGAIFGGALPPAIVLRAALGETWGASGAFGVALALQAFADGVPGGAAARGSSGSRTGVRRALILDCGPGAHFGWQFVEAGD